ncbi:hypothetical protein AYX14_06827 [Cryptococcus neoformans]|nr:hypothetical protein AYX14_06827 [Cryptococcus neoformans var. grubii]
MASNFPSDSPVNILLIGLGSIGSIYAYLLEKSGKARVTAVARSNYTLYTTDGVTLDTERFGEINNWKPYRVFKTQQEALNDGTFYASCIVCTKCLPDVLPNVKLLEDTTASDQIGSYHLIQNGLGIEEDLYTALESREIPILSSCAWIGIMTSSDGQVVSWRGQDILVTGIYPPASPETGNQTRTFSLKETEALNLWVDLLRAGEGNVHTTERIDSIRFSKNVWNCAWASVQGLVRATALAFAPLSLEQAAVVKAYFREIVAVGFEAGLLWKGMIQYPSGEISAGLEDVVNYCWDKIIGMAVARGVGHKYSLLIDVETGRPFELEVIIGSVLRLAQKNNIETPRLEYTYVLLKVLQGEILREKRMRVN